MGGVKRRGEEEEEEERECLDAFLFSDKEDSKYSRSINTTMHCNGFPYTGRMMGGKVLLLQSGLPALMEWGTNSQGGVRC